MAIRLFDKDEAERTFLDSLPDQESVATQGTLGDLGDIDLPDTEHPVLRMPENNVDWRKFSQESQIDEKEAGDYEDSLINSMAFDVSPNETLTDSAPLTTALSQDVNATKKKEGTKKFYSSVATLGNSLDPFFNPEVPDTKNGALEKFFGGYKVLRNISKVVGKTAMNAWIGGSNQLAYSTFTGIEVLGEELQAGIGFDEARAAEARIEGEAKGDPWAPSIQAEPRVIREIKESVGQFAEDFGASGREFYKEIADEHAPPTHIAGKNIIDNPELLADPVFWIDGIVRITPPMVGAMAAGLGAGQTVRVGGSTLKLSPKVIDRLYKIAIPLFGGGAGGSLEGAGLREEALAIGKTPEEARSAYYKMTLASGALNAFSLNLLLNKIPSQTKGAVLSWLTTGKVGTAAVGAVGEGVPEGLEELVGAFILDQPMSEAWKDGVTVALLAAVPGAGGAVAARPPSVTEGVEVTEPPVEKTLEEAIRERGIENVLPEDRAPEAFPNIPDIQDEQIDDEGITQGITDVRERLDRGEITEEQALDELERGFFDRLADPLRGEEGAITIDTRDTVTIAGEQLDLADPIQRDNAIDRGLELFRTTGEIDMNSAIAQEIIDAKLLIDELGTEGTAETVIEARRKAEIAERGIEQEAKREKALDAILREQEIEQGLTLLSETGAIDLTSPVALDVIKARILNEAYTVRDNFNDILDIGRSVFAEGKAKVEDFTARMKEVLGEAWEKVKPFIETAWNVLNNERGAIEIGPEGKRPKTQIREATGQVKGTEKVISERDALRAQFRAEARTALRAERSTRKEEKVIAQTRLKDILKRGREQRETTARRNQLRKQIKKALQTTKAKLVGGKPKGKFTPDIQNVLDQLREASRTTPQQALDKIAQNMADAGGKWISDAAALENKILWLVHDFGNKTVPELETLLAEITALKDEGAMINELKKFNRQAQVERWVIDAVDVLTGGKGLPEGADARTRKANYDRTINLTDRTKQWFSNQGLSMVGWKDILDILSRLDPSKPFQSRLSEIADVLDVKNAEKSGNRVQVDRMQELYREAFGITAEGRAGDREMIKRMQEDAKLLDLGTFLDLQRRTVPIEISVSEARKRYMEFQDPSLEATFTEGMGYTNEMKQAILDVLTPQDRAYADAQLAFYQEYYDSINETYRDFYGVDLPRNPNYSPIRREGFGRDLSVGFGEFLQEINLSTSPAPGGTRSRTDNILPIRPMSDVAVMEQHMAEMEHFKAWAEKVRDLRAIFDNTEVRAAIETFHDPKLIGVLDNFITDFTRGSVDTSNNMDWIDKWRSRIARSVLAVKPSIGVKQLTSFVAYSDAMPVSDFVKYSTQFWKNPVENAKFLYANSTLLAERGQHMERDIKDAMRSDEFQAWRKAQSFMNTLMLNIKMGDQGAIVMGGWPLYKYTLDQGATHEEAIRKFESVTESTQQSADLSELSTIQRGGSFAKLFTLYRSSPNQYFRKEIAALRNLFAGRQSIQQTAKTLLIFHIILPSFFQFVSDGLEWDEEEQLRAMVFGPLNGIFIAGDIIDALIRTGLGLRDFDAEIPLMSIKDDLKRAIRLVNDNDITDADVLNAIRGIAGATGAVTGFPAKTAVDLGIGIKDITVGDYELGAYEVLGWSPYKAQKATEDDKKGQRRR